MRGSAEAYGVLIQQVSGHRKFPLIETAPKMLNRCYRALGPDPVPLEVI